MEKMGTVFVDLRWKTLRRRCDEARASSARAATSKVAMWAVLSNVAARLDTFLVCIRWGSVSIMVATLRHTVVSTVPPSQDCHAHRHLVIVASASPLSATPTHGNRSTVPPASPSSTELVCK